jgi:hypothetical protein
MEIYMHFCCHLLCHKRTIYRSEKMFRTNVGEKNEIFYTQYNFVLRFKVFGIIKQMRGSAPELLGHAQPTFWAVWTMNNLGP